MNVRQLEIIARFTRDIDWTPGSRPGWRIGDDCKGPTVRLRVLLVLEWAIRRIRREWAGD